MNVHEYQAKAILSAFGVPVPRGVAAFSVDEAVKAARDLGGPVYVVKAQIHAGGRGKAGGVKVVKSLDEVRQAAERMLGATLVTHQTGPRGKEVHRLYVEEGAAIEREFYLSALVDRGRPGYRRGGAVPPGEDRHLQRRSGDRHHAASWAQRGARARSQR